MSHRKTLYLPLSASWPSHKRSNRTRHADARFSSPRVQTETLTAASHTAC